MRTKESRENMRKEKGITLIALVITIIVLLILAGVGISNLIGEGGILNKAKTAGITQEEKEAKEKLELVLQDLTISKHTDPTYNQNKYIDYVIEKENMTIIEDMVMVDGWLFEIDRSIPKISLNLGKGTENETIGITASTTINMDYVKGSLQANIAYNGTIQEIIIKGTKIEVPTPENGVYTITYEVKENGTYTIVVKDEENNYKIGKVEVAGITEDMNIYNSQDMAKFRDMVNSGRTFEGKTIQIKNDIDMKDICSMELGSWVPIGYKDDDITKNVPFQGTLEGNYKKIKNLYISTTNSLQGLFSILGKEGKMTHLIVEGNIETTGAKCAGIVAYNLGRVENCINNVAIFSEKNSPGGITSLNGGVIYRCINNGNIRTLSESGGGIAGGNGNSNEVGIISECINKGEIHSEDWTNGGIVGTNGCFGTEGKGYICNSYNVGTITGGKDRRGGIVGQVKCRGGRSYIYNCYNRGEIAGCPEIIGYDFGEGDNVPDQGEIEAIHNYGKLEATITKLNVDSNVPEELKKTNLYRFDAYVLKDGMISLDWE